MDSAVESLFACENCDQLHRRLTLGRGEKAICQRCGDRLYGSEIGSLERTLALNIAALALFVIANVMLFLHVSMEGRVQTNRILSGVTDLIGFDFMPLATLIFFTTMLAPLLKILATLYAVSAALLRRHFPGVAGAMRTAEVLSTWSMLEVYLLAVLVTVGKLSMMASVDLRVGSYAFFALILISTAANSALESEAVWSRLEESR
jgi:paraquat-inducible protein A